MGEPADQTGAAPAPLNVAIFGSCVSRDAVGLVPELLTPAHYTARQSWVSAASGRVWLPPNRLKSKFQERMLRSDFQSDLLTQITRHAPTADLVVIDLIDERLGVIEMLPRRFVTLSNELSSSGVLIGNGLLRRRRLQLGDPEHFTRFSEAASRVKQALLDAEAWQKTLLVRGTYAARSIEGDDLMGDLGIDPQTWNELFEPYYELLTELGFRFIQPREDLLFSTREHQWGMHPIHYQPSASLDLAEQMIDAYRSHSAG